MPDITNGRAAAGRQPDRFLARQFSGKGQQRHVAGALDRLGHQALMPGTGARLAARADLAPVRNQAAQHVDGLVIDGFVLFGAKFADADPSPASAAPVLAFLFAAFIVTAAWAAFLFHWTLHIVNLAYLLRHSRADHPQVRPDYARGGLSATTGSPPLRWSARGSGPGC